MSSPISPVTPTIPDDSQSFQFVFGQLSLGKRDAVIVNALVGKGVPAEKAQTIVQTARVRRTTAFHNRGKRRIKIGSIALAVGVVITVGSYLAAAFSAGGGVYFVTFGPILLGLYYLGGGILDVIKR